MRFPPIRTLGLLSALAALAAPGVGAPGGPGNSAPLILQSPLPAFETPEGEAGLRPVVRGFGRTSRPGEPELPLRVLLVAIPEGSVPELLIQTADPVLLTGLDVLPVATIRVEDRRETLEDRGGGRGTTAGRPGRPRSETVPKGVARESRRDRRIYDRDAFFPEAPVRLGRVGYLRAQRFVEVLYTPVLYNPVRRQARFFPEIRAEVLFSGARPEAAVAEFRPDPFFEDSYRASLVNYEQGKLFRVEEAAPAAPAPAEGPAKMSVPVAQEATAVEGPRFKLLVSRAGVYRLDHAVLSASAPALLSLDPRTYFVQVDGAEIPISVRSVAGGGGESDGVFGADDVLEFVGQPKIEPPTEKNYDYTTIFPDIFQAMDFTDTQVYWLQAGGAPGSHSRIAAVGGAPAGGFPLAADFEEKVVWEENNFFLPLGEEDPYYSAPLLQAGSTAAQRDLSVPLPGIAVTSTPATVDVRMRGGSNPAQAPDHKVRVWVNSDTAEAGEYTWDGDAIMPVSPTLAQFNVAQSVLTNPSTLHVQALLLPGVSLDLQLIDRLTVTYRRLFTAVGGSLVFSYPNVDARFQVSGLGATPSIYEITDRVAANGEAAPVLITGAVPGGAPSAYTFEVPRSTSPGAPAVRVFAIAGPGGYLVPDAVQAAADPVLAVPGQSADILVIGSEDTLDDAPGGALDLLLAHRLATQGLTSRVIRIGQIYDEFGFGRRNPNAIRAFLSYAYDNWRGPSGTLDPPSFLMLVGDATADYKDNQHRSDWVDQVPTPILFQLNSIIGYYSSDNLLASFRGDDQVPDIFLGRVSARSAAEAAGVFTKIRLYEQSPPPGLWRGRALLAADKGRSDFETLQFETVQTNAATRYFTAPPYSVPNPPLYYAKPPWSSTDAAGFKSALVNELNGGSAVFSYVGHGAFDVLGLDTLLTSQDAAALHNGPYLPLFAAFDCLAGGFHSFSTTGSLAEVMTNNPAGGSIASIASSGLSSVLVGEIMSREMFGPLFGREKERLLGQVHSQMHAGVWLEGMITDAQSLTFLGDPATLLATPSPPPPTGLTAVAGNGQVSLSWTAAAGPVSAYRVYRAATDPTSPYVEACSPGASTSCVDSGVINATRYYYYAVSLDPDMFEGPVSNFNADCDAGPGCVTARPTNPNPPSVPAGLATQDAGIGGVLSVSWTPSPETDIKQYTLRYGTEPGVYPLASGAAGGASSLLLTGLVDSVRYYMVLTATNTSGFESAPSVEVSGVSHLIQGIAPPRAITDLRLAPSGSNLVLTWTRPTTDIYGRPTTVAGYRVYRALSPGFNVASSNPIAIISPGSTTTFTDSQALLSPQAYYYVVTAVDALGLVSGGGRDLPNGVSDLAVTLPAQDQVHLSWTPPTTDMQGLATIIDHYQVHVTAMPVSRGSLNSSTMVLDNVPVPSVDLSLPGNPRFLSVIAVDNRGNASPF